MSRASEKQFRAGLTVQKRSQQLVPIYVLIFCLTIGSVILNHSE
jgi:hypothetical protein